jgi:uncharacterized protein YjbI with pentapeptide repeats
VANNGGQQRKPDFKTAVEDLKAIAVVFALEAETVLGRKTARVLGVLALFVVLLALLIWYIEPSGADQRNNVIATLAQTLVGMVLLLGLYFTWRTLQVNREGQITERFTRAIDQLGKTNEEGEKLFEIRLGGIYALERIARESAEDYWPIMEVLTAYVRQHAPRRREEERGGEADAAVEKNIVEGSSGKSKITEDLTLNPDIQAIMTVLRRRTRYFGHGEPEPLNLRETHLSGADLRGADLREANLRHVNLQKARLSGAKLHNARLQGAILTGAILAEAILPQAILVGANLHEAFLARANLTEAILPQTDLSGADLAGVRLLEATLWKANLTEANLAGADLSEANLSGANLSGADLSGANLSGADLSGANLSGADLMGADLSGADLSRAHLTQAQLEGTTGDENTKLPPDLKPPTNWGV